MATQETSSPTPPAKLGYHMPGEFEAHLGCWMAWPDEKGETAWRQGAGPAQAQHAAIAKAIAQFEPVTVFVNAEAAALAREYFKLTPAVTVTELPYNDSWIRDWGPTCIVRDDPSGNKREVAGVHWAYNSYGAAAKVKDGRMSALPNYDKDLAAGRIIMERLHMTPFVSPLHLEGGSIHCDGDGTLLVTAECLLDSSRNPLLDKAGIEKDLKEFLGVDKVIWLERGMMADSDTDGHIDNIACFASPGNVLMCWCEDENDPQTEVCQRNLEILEQETDARGRRLQVTKVPCPYPAMFRTFKESSAKPSDLRIVAGQRLAGSYINHYIANGGVVVPQFGGRQSETDKRALEVLAKAYPDRNVVGVQSREILLGGGNIHCITQQHVAGWQKQP